MSSKKHKGVTMMKKIMRVAVMMFLVGVLSFGVFANDVKNLDINYDTPIPQDTPAPQPDPF